MNQLQRQRNHHKYLVLFILSLTPGCDTPGPDQPTEARVELGTGTLQFESLADEQSLSLIAGPQGGHHFVVHARCQGLIPGDPAMPGLPDNPATTFAVYDESERQLDLMNPPYRLGYRDRGDGWFALPSGRILQLLESEVAGAYQSRLRIVVKVRDAVGHETSDERWIVAVDEGASANALEAHDHREHAK